MPYDDDDEFTKFINTNILSDALKPIVAKFFIFIAYIITMIISSIILISTPETKAMIPIMMLLIIILAVGFAFGVLYIIPLLIDFSIFLYKNIGKKLFDAIVNNTVNFIIDTLLKFGIKTIYFKDKKYIV